jgi:membrane associated rhomboid family serine protease
MYSEVVPVIRAYTLIPIKEKRKLPFITITLSCLHLFIYIGYAVNTGDPFTATGPIGGPKECYFGIANPITCKDWRPEVYRLACNQFVHISIVHVLSNFLTLLVIGIPLEMMHGSLRVFSIFHISLVCGNLSNAIFAPNTILVGASGGIYGILGTWLANLYLNWNEIKNPIQKLVSTVGTVVIQLILFWFSVESGVGYIAHIFGFLTGSLIGLFILKNLIITRYETLVKIIASVIYFILLLLVIIWYSVVTPGCASAQPSL